MKRDIIRNFISNFLPTLAIALALLSALCVSASAQETLPTVVEVEVVGANNSSVDLIKSVANILPGTQINTTVVRDAVVRLDGLALFEDVKILVEDVAGGVKLYIVVKERPKLTSIDFQGNKKIKDEDLQEKLRLQPGAYVTDFTFFDKRNQILRAYADKGYFLTQVKYELDYNADSTEVSAVFKVTENSKIKVRHVYLYGAEQMDSSDLVGKMSNRKKGFLRSSDFNRDKLDEDMQKIAEEYHKNGFIDAYVMSDSLVVDTPANRVDIYVHTYEGPRYYFGNYTFSDNEVRPDKSLEDNIKFEPGDVFNQEVYDESVFEMYTGYHEIGYLHARILDEKKFRDTVIDVSYQVIEGLPSKINLVQITGNNKTKDKVIRRELTVLPGQTFHRSLLMRSLRDVMALNYFKNVVPDVKDLPNGDVDIVMNVEEKQTGQVNAGAGYSARDKLVGTFGLGIPNLFGNGQELNFNLEFGGRRNSSQVSFTEPWMFGRPTLFGADLFSLNRQYEGFYTEGRRGGGIRLGRRLRWPDNYFRISASYRLQGDRFYDFSELYLNTNQVSTVTKSEYKKPASSGDSVTTSVVNSTVDRPNPGSLLEFGERWNTASIISLTLTRDSRNLPEFATSGSRFKYTIAKGGGFMGGFWNFTRHNVEYIKFIRIYKNIALAAQFQFGAVTGPTDRKILETEKFSPGGTSYEGVVRGYDDGSLRPDTLISDVYRLDTVITSRYEIDTVPAIPDTNFVGIDTATVLSSQSSSVDPVRGKYMFVTNIELTVPLAENTLYFLTFFDAGNSWLRWNDIKPINDMYSGAGIGFRLVIPGIGTLGFDFGYPLSNRVDIGTGKLIDRGIHTHFQIGTVFR